MNPLVEKMLEGTVETYLLEDLFEQEVKCESRHEDPENAYCSGDVTHLISKLCNGVKGRICDACTAYVERCRNNPKNVCESCDLSCFECWTIRPI